MPYSDRDYPTYAYDYQGYRSAEPYRGPSLRVIAGIVIAVIALISYFSRTEVNPVTGERQRIAMNVDQEMALGIQSAPEMAAKMGGIVDPRDPRSQTVTAVGRRLVERSDARKSPYVNNFRFYLLADPRTVNAFALPGGPIFITRALYEKLSNESELAGVLGHEIGHVINRHAAEHMATGQLGQMLTTAFGIGASGNRDGGRNAVMIAAMVNQLTQLRFSREDESESDHYGLKYMAQAGYDPTGMLKVMEVLKEASKGASPPEFLATHPLPESRLVEIRDELKQAYPNGIPSDLTPGRPLPGGADDRGLPRAFRF
ncbi:MAG: M48 family metalloprotease [Isosphaeraceae bacterium]